MTTVAVRVGHPEYGYRQIGGTLPASVNEILQRYIDEVAPKYEGELVEKNVSLAKRLLSGRKLDSKHLKTVYASAALLLALTTPMPTHAMGIDLGPIDQILSDGYWTLLKFGLYLLMIAYSIAGLNLIGAAGDSGKRTRSKQIAVWSTLGILIICGAPWAGHTIYTLGTHVFSKYTF